METVLGLDLGTNSIGWALIDGKHKNILGMGTRIFPEGVVNLGDGEGREMSKNSERTLSRSVRRQIFRRAYRKKYLLKHMAKYGMCPLDESDFYPWKPKQVFSKERMTEWFKLNPYELRALATEQKVSLLELGRIFYHMVQRRGFQSNSRSAGEEEGKIYEGNNAEGKTGILETQEKLNGSTLGKYLFDILPKYGEPFQNQKERVRNRYTTRQMYIDEFERIWSVQEKHHEVLNDELKALLGGRKKDGYKNDGILFHQRPLRTQKYLRGKCTFEPSKTKSQASALIFEKFKVHQWINSIECNGENLNEEDRKKVEGLLFSKEKPTFKVVRKAIGKEGTEYQFNYKDDDKAVGTHTISNLSNKKFFGKNWFNLSDKEQEDIWHTLYFFDDRNKLKEYAIKNWGFDEDKATKISKFNLKSGYAHLSKKAIRNILPFLEMGYGYDMAVALGGINNALNGNWAELDEQGQTLILDNIFDIVRSGKKGGYINDLKTFLSEQFDFSEKQLNKLYHHSSNIKNHELLSKLPLGKEADKEIQSIRNPVVIAALFEIRKLVNEIIDQYGKPDTIKVELARNLKISKKRRNEIRRQQQELERQNDRIKAELDHLGQRRTHENLLKYKLWEEANHKCPFTGKEIGIKQLFSGEVQIEHIQPWSRSLNDSFMNKTLCYADENRKKGNRTPYEYYFNEFGAETWDEKKKQALDCFKNKKNYPKAYLKFKQFVSKKIPDDFVERQMNDTRYISKEAKNYLGKICNDIQVSPGQVTSNLRHYWGLNSILNAESDEKTRDDHRHHAIDALVMACSTRSHLQELSRWNRYERNSNLKEFPMPWESFREDAEKAANRILVSHKKTDNVLTSRIIKTKKDGKVYENLGISARGPLHKETVFGRRQSPEGETCYHVRKPLTSLSTEKHIKKIVDPVIREIIMERVEELGGFEKGKLPPNTFFEKDEEGNLHPQIFLPNKNGEPVPIKKVRIREKMGSAEQLTENNQYVNPRNNHHVLIYKDEKGNLKEDVVTLWKAVERKKQGEPLFKLPSIDSNGKIVAALQINDFFLLNLDEGQEDINKANKGKLSNHLYRVQKLSSKFYEFRKHTESKLDNNEYPHYVRIQSFGEGKTGWKNFNPIKVRLNSIGEIKVM